jgi:hypothetical protein
MWWQVVAAFVGIGLMAAPDLVGLAESPANFVNATAPIGVAFAVIATSEVTRGMRYVTVLSGLVIAVGSALLGVPFPELALIGGGGLAMAGLAFGGGDTSGRYGGGWRSLLG